MQQQKLLVEQELKTHLVLVTYRGSQTVISLTGCARSGFSRDLLSPCAASCAASGAADPYSLAALHLLRAESCVQYIRI